MARLRELSKTYTRIRWAKKHLYGSLKLDVNIRIKYMRRQVLPCNTCNWRDSRTSFLQQYFNFEMSASLGTITRSWTRSFFHLLILFSCRHFSFSIVVALIPSTYVSLPYFSFTCVFCSSFFPPHSWYFFKQEACEFARPYCDRCRCNWETGCKSRSRMPRGILTRGMQFCDSIICLFIFFPFILFYSFVPGISTNYITACVRF